MHTLRLAGAVGLVIALVISVLTGVTVWVGLAIAAGSIAVSVFVGFMVASLFIAPKVPYVEVRSEPVCLATFTGLIDGSESQKGIGTDRSPLEASDAILVRADGYFHFMGRNADGSTSAGAFPADYRTRIVEDMEMSGLGTYVTVSMKKDETSPLCRWALGISDYGYFTHYEVRIPSGKIVQNMKPSE